MNAGKMKAEVMPVGYHFDRDGEIPRLHSE